MQKIYYLLFPAKPNRFCSVLRYATNSKKIFATLLTVLAIALLGFTPRLSYAASCVSVRQVAANYNTKQVTFDVVWSTCTGTHNYKTWVIVDYRTVNADGSKGAWTRAAISGTSVGTLVSASKGVWVTGSASKTQRVTLTLSGMPAQFDWCASALDYPPQAIMNNGSYTLKGTPPFTINSSTALGANVKNYTGACITSVTDVTNNPEGIVINPVFTAGTIASTGQVFCSGSAYTTIGSATAASGGDGRITYQWLRNGTAIGSTNNATYVPTQEGTYTRQAKDGTCNTTWATSTGSWVVTGVSIPAVPTLSATTTCEGTAITFTAAASDVTGYDWAGAGVTAGSATATTRASTATTAGSYAAKVRSYITASDTTCYSAYTSNVTGVIKNGTTIRDAVPNSCGCAIGLTAVGGGTYGTGNNTYTTTAYCRDLTSDAAYEVAEAGIEIKNKNTGYGYFYCNTGGSPIICPTGWRVPSLKEWYAMSAIIPSSEWTNSWYWAGDSIVGCATNVPVDMCCNGQFWYGGDCGHKQHYLYNPVSKTTSGLVYFGTCRYLRCVR